MTIILIINVIIVLITNVIMLRLEVLILEGNSLRSLPAKLFSEATMIRLMRVTFTSHCVIKLSYPQIVL